MAAITWQAIVMCFFCFIIKFNISSCDTLSNYCGTGTAVVAIPSGRAFNCSVPSNTTLKLAVDNIGSTTTAVMIQVHSLEEPLRVEEPESPEEGRTGLHLGILRYVSRNESRVSWSVKTVSATGTVDVLFMATFYSASDPIPGACNQIFIPENEPNLHFNGSKTSDMGRVEFADGNVGNPREIAPPVCDDKDSGALQLLYSVYIYYMPTEDYSNGTMMAAVQKMLRPEDVQKYGQKVITLQAMNQKKIYLALFKNRGTVYNVIVQDPNRETFSTYVPYVVYACDQKSNGTVCTYTDMGPTMVYTFCGLLGVLLCFLGHWTFLYEMFMFGFLPGVIGVYMLFAANTTLLLYGIMTASVCLGIVGGMMLTTLWWRFGRVPPTVIWISLVLGFLLTSVLFFTAFGSFQVWQDDTVFGLAFSSAVLVPAIFGLLFQKWMSMIASAVIGSYMMTSTLSFFFGGILHYIIQNVIHRATIENFEKAIFVVPANPIDFILAVLWCSFAIGGVVTQAILTRGQSDFPECPYKSFKVRRRLLRSGCREGNSHAALVSGTIQSDHFDSDHSPLVGDL